MNNIPRMVCLQEEFIFGDVSIIVTRDHILSSQCHHPETVSNNWEKCQVVLFYLPFIECRGKEKRLFLCSGLRIYSHVKITTLAGNDISE